MIKVGLGQSEHIDTRTAVENAVLQCRQMLAGCQPNAGIVFAGVNFDHRLMLDEILGQFPGMDLIGCTTAGDFSSGYGFSEDSVSLLAFYSDDIEIGIGVGRSISDDPEAAVQAAVKHASQNLSKPPSVCLTFPDGYHTSFGPVMKILNQALGHGCPVFGGAAGTLWNEDLAPLQFYKDEILVNAIPIMLFSGPLEYSFSIANSWQPVGKQTTITKAEGLVVKNIGNFTAVDFYRHYLGDHSEPAREFILAVYDKDGDHKYLRAPIQYNEDKSITFSESIPMGATVQLTEATRKVMIDDTQSTSRKIAGQLSGMVPQFVMAFSCAFRKDILGTRVEEELKILGSSLPKQLPIVGFYSFGEIAPLVRGEESYFHGATLVTLLIGNSNGHSGTKDGIGLPQPSAVDPGPADMTDSGDAQSMARLKLENEFLKRKLNRSESYRERLEEIKDFNSNLHHKIIVEVEEARKEVQQKESLLRKSEEKYRRIVTTAGEGFILMDEDMIITDVNDALCRLIGYEKRELLGKTPLDFGADEFRDFLSVNQETISSDEYRTFEGTLKAKDGSLIPILTHGSKLRDDSGTVIGNMAFVTDLTEQKKALALAAEVQKNLLPRYGVHIPGLDVAGKNVSCDEIGGDYFDFLDQTDYPNAPLSIVVGDIAGHGVDAALLMTTARAFLRMRASQSGNISEIINEMNRHLTSDVLDTGRFMTLFYLAIDPDKKHLRWVRAGHDPAIIYDPKQNTFEELTGIGMALGVSEDFRYEENVKTIVDDGQIIALGTDGIWEARNKEGDMFGKEKFRQIIRQNAKENAVNILNAVYDELNQHTRGIKSDDDITLVIAKVSRS